MKSIEQQLAEATEQVKALTTENATLKEAAKVAGMATVKATLDQQIAENKLPVPCADALRKQFVNATTVDGIKEAIATQVELVKAVTTVKKNNGADDNGPGESDAKKAKANLVESFQKCFGVSKERAEQMAE